MTFLCRFKRWISSKSPRYKILFLILFLKGMDLLCGVTYCYILYTTRNYRYRGKCSTKEDNEPLSWMETLDDKMPINQISIPGSHDTMCYEKHCCLLKNEFTRCHTFTLTGQLDAGIRFFDIRCEYKSGDIKLYHGPIDLKKVDKHITPAIKTFLDGKGAFDFVILRIKQEKNPTEDFGDTVFNSEKCFMGLNKYLWKPDPEHPKRIPVLGEVRRKIIIIKDFKGETSQAQSFGIPISDLHLSDDYIVKENWTNSFLGYFENKWNCVKSHLSEARQIVKDWNRKPLHVTFISANSLSDSKWKLILPFMPAMFTIGSPRRVSEFINKKLSDYLGDPDVINCGIIVMDFPTKALIQKIIDTNKISSLA